MSKSSHKNLRSVLTGLGFLAPNIIGVLVFTILPVIFSVVLAFSNWDLRRHNMFNNETLQFVGFDNFIRLFKEPDFLRFFGNTLFLMMGIPFAVGGALLSAILLSKEPRGKGPVTKWILGTGLLVSTVFFLTVMGMGGTGMTLMLTGIACFIFIAGTTGGVATYRTFFYLPNFTAGVATFLLWKKLYNPQTGPINGVLRPVLETISNGVNTLPSGLVGSVFWVCFVIIILILAWTLQRLYRSWADGDLGTIAAILPVIFLSIPTLVACNWSYTSSAAWVLVAAFTLLLLYQGSKVVKGRDFTCTANEGFGTALMMALFMMVIQFVFLGFSAVFDQLPAMAQQGLEPPTWIADYNWAKPSIMAMGLWAAIGSNNMLLYLAALTNVSTELYEASEIDGANRFQKFWHVTWPQLAPTTFFILVMSVIGGLQGGFEMARTMTHGGPDGATTTLSYFIYTEGFETGRLGFAAAVSWALFILVFAITMFNWKFGSRYAND